MMTLDEIDPTLLRKLRTLGDNYGPTGVANAAALLTAGDTSPPPVADTPRAMTYARDVVPELIARAHAHAVRYGVRCRVEPCPMSAGAWWWHEELYPPLRRLTPGELAAEMVSVVEGGPTVSVSAAPGPAQVSHMEVSGSGYPKRPVTWTSTAVLDLPESVFAPDPEEDTTPPEPPHPAGWPKRRPWWRRWLRGHR